MKNLILITLLATYSSVSFAECTRAKFALVVHGGVDYQSNELQKELLRDILKEGHEMLKSGDSSLNAVQHVVERMEDSGIFNAGRGGTRTNQGTVELDASIMDGATMKAGSGASLKDVKNPIRFARMVMDKSRHVMMVGPGASQMARDFGLELVEPSYFVGQPPLPHEKHFGTVGAVALDRCANLASATSTGGLYGKAPGRVGDSPVIGAGTYANNKTVAVSCTGEGEKFIRANASVRISNILEYTERNLSSAVEETLALVKTLGGSGGIISLEKDGNIVTSTNDSAPMPRGYVREDGAVVVTDFNH